MWRAGRRLLFHQRQRHAEPFVLGDRAELHALDLVVEHPERRCRFELNSEPPVQVVSVMAYGLAGLDRTRPDRRISLPSSVRVPRSKLRNRIAQLPSSRWVSAIVSFRIGSDR